MSGEAREIDTADMGLAGVMFERKAAEELRAEADLWKRRYEDARAEAEKWRTLLGIARDHAHAALADTEGNVIG